MAKKGKDVGAQKQIAAMANAASQVAQSASTSAQSLRGLSLVSLALSRITKPITSSFSRLQKLLTSHSKTLKNQEVQQRKWGKSAQNSSVVLRNWGDTITSINSRFSRAVVSLKNLGQSIYDVSMYGFQAKDKLLGFGNTIASAIRSYSPAQAKQIEVAMGRFRATVGMVLAPAVGEISNLFVNLSKKLIALSKKMDLKKIIKWAVFGLLVTIIAGLVLTFGLLVGGIVAVVGIVGGFIRGLQILGRFLVFGSVRAVVFGLQVLAAVFRLGVAAVQVGVYMAKIAWAIIRGLAQVIVWSIKASIQLISFALRGTLALLGFVLRGTVFLAQFALQGSVALLRFAAQGVLFLTNFAITGIQALARFAVSAVTMLISGSTAGIQVLSSFVAGARQVLVSAGTMIMSFASGAVGALRGLMTSLAAFRVSAIISTVAQTGLNVVHGIFAAITSPIVIGVLQIALGILLLVAVLWYFWDDIVAFFDQVWQGISDFFSGILDTLVGWFDSAVNAVVSFFSGIWQTISGWFTGVVNSIKGFFQNIWANIKAFFDKIINTVRSIYENYIKPIIGMVVEKIQWVWDKLVGFFKWLWGKIKWLIGGSRGDDGKPPGAQHKEPQLPGMPNLDDLKNLGADLQNALSQGPAGMAEFGAKMLEKAGMGKMADGLRKFSKEFDALFEAPGDDSEVPHEAKEGKSSTIEDIGKQARLAALGTADPPKQTAEATKKTAKNTEGLSKALGSGDMSGSLQDLGKVFDTGQQKQVDTQTTGTTSLSQVVQQTTEQQTQGFSEKLTSITSQLENVNNNLGGALNKITETLNSYGTHFQSISTTLDRQVAATESTKGFLQTISENLQSSVSSIRDLMNQHHQELTTQQNTLVENARAQMVILALLTKLNSQKQDEAIGILSRIEETQRQALSQSEKMVDYLGANLGLQKSLVDMERAARASYQRLVKRFRGEGE